ncbi:hypothetical protein F5B17DRAFT_396226 [Nemania serpens]|nr:hypothetical protein F5B17DRAFT_396226 [Nemania serpens]
MIQYTTQLACQYNQSISRIMEHAGSRYGAETFGSFSSYVLCYISFSHIGSGYVFRGVSKYSRRARALLCVVALRGLGATIVWVHGYAARGGLSALCSESVDWLIRF